MSDVQDMQRRALQIASHYDDYNRARGRQTWGLQEYVDGLVGDIGDLTKIIMAMQGKRDMEDMCTKVEHELNDVMWSVLLLYKMFQLDPEASFSKAMNALEARVVKLKAQSKVRA
jgi:NTP pyrophosphatase (non-canonical NTP hydrolase)